MEYRVIRHAEGTERKDHKYVARIPIGNGKGYRYFYTKAEWQAYLRDKKTAKDTNSLDRPPKKDAPYPGKKQTEYEPKKDAPYPGKKQTEHEPKKDAPYPGKKQTEHEPKKDAPYPGKKQTEHEPKKDAPYPGNNSKKFTNENKSAIKKSTLSEEQRARVKAAVDKGQEWTNNLLNSMKRKRRR